MSSETTRAIRDRDLVELAQKLNCLSLDELMQVAISSIPPLVRGRNVTIYLLEGATLRLKTSTDPAADADEAVEPEDASALITEVYREREALLIQDVHAYVESRQLPITLGRRTPTSLMLVPIWSGAGSQDPQLIGVIRFADTTDFSAFGKRDLAKASGIGAVLGDAVVAVQILQSKVGDQRDQLEDERRALESTLHKRETIQNSLEEARRRVELLLPSPPESESLDIACWHRALEAIGGVFYDFIPLARGAYGVALGRVDVQGIEAALLISMAKQTLSVCCKARRSPHDVLTLADSELAAALGGSRQVTAVYATFDLLAGELCFACAGHPVPLMRRADGAILRLDGSGEPLGREDVAPERTEQIAPLTVGDLILLISEGALAVTDEAGQTFGEARLQELLAEQPSEASAEAVCQAVGVSLTEFAAAEPSADWTVIAVRCASLPVGGGSMVDSLLDDSARAMFDDDEETSPAPSAPPRLQQETDGSPRPLLTFEGDSSDEVPASDSSGELTVIGARPQSGVRPSLVRTQPAPPPPPASEGLEQLLVELRKGDPLAAVSSERLDALAEKLEQVATAERALTFAEAALAEVEDACAREGEPDPDRLQLHLEEHLPDPPHPVDGMLREGRFREALQVLAMTRETAAAKAAEDGDVRPLLRAIEHEVALARALGPIKE